MNIWLRRYIGLTGVGGGLVGLMLVVGYTSQAYDQLGWDWLTVLFFFTFYAWFMSVGFLVLEGKLSKLVVSQAFIAQAIQLPVLSLPFLKYGIFSGFHIDIAWTLPLKLNILFDVASRATFSVFPPGDDIIIGINIAALITACLLWKVLTATHSESSLEPEIDLKQEDNS